MRIAASLALSILVFLAGCAGPPVAILLPYGSYWNYRGTPYSLELSEGTGRHLGIDIGANMTGAPVLAAAEGVVVRAREPLNAGCGTGVILLHPQFALRTIYCHLATLDETVREGSSVERGVVIGMIGGTGAAGPTPHLHFEVRDLSGDTQDPEKLIVGCFDPTKTYLEKGPPAFTWPIKCRSGK